MHAAHCSTKEGLQDEEDGRVTGRAFQDKTANKPNTKLYCRFTGEPYKRWEKSSFTKKQKIRQDTSGLN